MGPASALLEHASAKTPTPLAHVMSEKNGAPFSFHPPNPRAPAEDIEKLSPSKLATPILCKTVPPPAAITDVQTQSPPLPRPAAPQPGLLNSQAKTARKSAHIPSNRGDGYSTSSSNGGKKPVHTHQSACAKTVDEGQETERTPTRLANGAEATRKGVSPANGVTTPQPRVQPSPPQQLQNSPQAGRRSIIPPPPAAPDLHPPPQMAGKKRPMSGLTDENASKSSHVKTPTQKTTASAQDPATTAPSNGSPAKKRNPRKRQADKPSEGPAKRPRTKTNITGTDVFSVRKGLTTPQQRFPAHDLPTALPTPPQQRMTARDPTWSRTPPKPPTYKVPPYRGTIPPPPRDQTNGAGQRTQLPSPPGTAVTPQPSPDGINQPANPHVVAQNRAPDVISISSSPVSSPSLSDSSLEAIYSRKSSASSRSLPITIEDSGSDTGGLQWVRDGAPGKFRPESRTLSPGGAVGAPKESRGKNDDSAASTTEGKQIERFVRGLENHLMVAVDFARKYYESNPSKAANYSPEVFDEYLEGREKLQMIDRFRFLLRHLRVYTPDRRVMMCSEACYEGISPQEGKFALTKYLDAWGLKWVSKPLKPYQVQAMASTTVEQKEPEEPKSGGETLPNSSSLPSSRLGNEATGPRVSECGGNREFFQIIGESSVDRPNTGLTPSGVAFRTERKADEIEAPLPPNAHVASHPIALPVESESGRAGGTSSPVDPCSIESVTTHQSAVTETTASKMVPECQDSEAAVQPNELDALVINHAKRERFSRPSVEDFVKENDSATEYRSKKLFLNNLMLPNDPISKRISSLREEESKIYKELDGMLAKYRQKESEFAGRLESTKTFGDIEDGLPDGGPEPDSGGSVRSFKVDWEAYWKVLREQQNFREILGRQQDKLVGRASRIHDERMDLIQLRGDRAAMEAESAQLSPSTIGGEIAQLSPSTIRGETVRLSPSAIKAETAQLPPNTPGAETAQLSPNAIGAETAQLSPSAIGAETTRLSPSIIGAETAQLSPSALEAISERRESTNPTAIPPPADPTGGTGPAPPYTCSIFRSSIGQELFDGLRTWAAFSSYSGTPPIASAAAPSGSEVGSKVKRRRRRVRN